MPPLSSSEPKDLDFGFVVIGRNEGERLHRCLESIGVDKTPTVYVDSGSTDGSRELARALGATVHELDLSRPFTAARARNAGWRLMLELRPDTRFIQFMDGDCRLHAGWLAAARQTALANPKAAIVFGHRQEIAPKASVYNLMCHMEWKHQPGEALTCGGDAFVRLEALHCVGGYDPSWIAGEEPDLCLRLRLAGWKILCLKEAMSDHDASMHRFGQWFKRSLRSGYASAEGLCRHGTVDSQNLHQVRSSVVWGLLWPGCLLVAVLATVLGGLRPWGMGLGVTLAVCSLTFVLGYARLFHRIWLSRLALGDSAADARLYARFCLLSKFSELAGVLLYGFNRLIGRRQPLIEYKTAAPSSPPG